MQPNRTLENASAKAYIAKDPKNKRRLKMLYATMIRIPITDEELTLEHRLRQIIACRYPHGYPAASDYLHALNWLSAPANRIQG